MKIRPEIIQYIKKRKGWANMLGPFRLVIDDYIISDQCDHLRVRRLRDDLVQKFPYNRKRVWWNLWTYPVIDKNDPVRKTFLDACEEIEKEIEILSCE